MAGPKGAKPPDEDAIAINSTESDEYSSSAEFLVNRILAERPTVRGKEYLILWEGYHVDKSTWEPIGNIQHDEILEAWKERQKLEQEGRMPPFNLAAHNARLKELEKAKRKRQQLRKQERKRREIKALPDVDGRRAEDRELTGAEEVAVKTKPKLQQKKSTKASAQRSRTEATTQSNSKSSSSDSDLGNDLFVGSNKTPKQKALQTIKNERTSRSSSPAISQDSGSAVRLSSLSQVRNHSSVKVSILTLYR